MTVTGTTTDGAWMPAGRLCLLLLVLVWPSELQGQEARLRFGRITPADGLPSGTVYAIAQDHLGFMWFGTPRGLVRYDGQHLQRWAVDPGGLSNADIRALHVDQTGTLWIGTDGGGLNSLDPSSGDVRRYGVDRHDPRALSHAEVRDIAHDASGRILVATGYGLDRLDPATGRFTRFRHEPGIVDSLVGNDVQAVHVDGAGIVWVGTRRGLSRLNPESDSSTHFRHDPEDAGSLANDHIYAIHPGPDGALWVGTDDGLSILGSGATSFSRLGHDPADPTSLAQDSINAIGQEATGTLWVGTWGGLHRYDARSGGFERFQAVRGDPSSLSSNSIRSIFQSRCGVLWVGTAAGGVNRFHHRSQQFMWHDGDGPTPTDLSASTVTAVHEDPAGIVWVADAAHLQRFDVDQSLFVPQPIYLPSESPPAGSFVTSVAGTADGRVWVGTWGAGVTRLGPGAGRLTRFRHDPEDPSSLSSDRVHFNYVDGAGAVWVATWEGLNRFDEKTGAFERYLHDPADPNSLSDDDVRALLEDREGHLWVGTDDGGLNRLDRSTGAFTRFSHQIDDPHSLSSNEIISLHEDGEGRLWIGVEGGGLDRYDRETGRFHRFGAAAGLTGERVVSILEDDDEKLWLGTDGGLVQFCPESGDAWRFDASDGLQPGEFGDRAAARSRSGAFLFGGSLGLNVFRPPAIQINERVPPVVFTSISVGGRLLNLSSQPDPRVLQLGHDERVISFDVAALDFEAPDKNQFAYRLDGSEWIDLGSDGHVTFSSMSPGRHTLQVKGSNNHGVWNEEGVQLELRVSPPWWGTWWFRVALLLLVGGMLLGIYQVRIQGTRRHMRELRAEIERRKLAESDREAFVRELEAKNVQLERFGYTVSHDLKSPLVTIKGFLGLLEKDVEAGELSKVKADAARIGSAADKMSLLLDDILDLSRVGRLTGETEDLPTSELAWDAAALVAGGDETAATGINVQGDMPDVHGDRTRLTQVFQNLIENAMKATGDREDAHIDIGARLENGRVLCWVADNGRGIEPVFHEKIFDLFERLEPGGNGTGIGLTLVRRVVEAHGGKAWAESDGRDKGATLWFSLPPARHSPSA